MIAIIKTLKQGDINIMAKQELIKELPSNVEERKRVGKVLEEALELFAKGGGGSFTHRSVTVSFEKTICFTK